MTLLLESALWAGLGVGVEPAVLVWQAVDLHLRFPFSSRIRINTLVHGLRSYVLRSLLDQGQLQRWNATSCKVRGWVPSKLSPGLALGLPHLLGVLLILVYNWRFLLVHARFLVLLRRFAEKLWTQQNLRSRLPLVLNLLIVRHYLSQLNAHLKY